MGIKPLGKFGGFVKQYEKARRPYPSEVFNFLKSLIKVKKPLILDLGCGTGISTRQLAKMGVVIGCDPDPIMIRHAKKHKSSGVKRYVIGSSQNLPFRNKTFDVVTAFSAFHWFYDKKNIAEIKRVLKPGGLFFVSGRTGIRSWGQGYRGAIVGSIKREVAQFVNPKDYNPEKILRVRGFKNMKTRSWKKSELYTLNNALEYVQSVSIWNSVPKPLRVKALKGLEKHFQNILKKHDKIERKLTVKAVAGVR